ncbi:MAG: dihydrolipoyl dehydrogenase [Candidatus Marinimicrobia bacterium]|nr:dihydrolipoyl dehydrogenase [Candidatus Neomarinimicrobiota bacterium]
MLKKIILLLLIATVLACFFIFDLGKYLDFQYLKTQQVLLSTFYIENKVFTISVYSGLYIVVAMLSLPGATIMTLAGGAIFGLFYGIIIVSVASTLGATFAMLNCRYLFRNAFQEKLKPVMKKVNHGMEKDGALFLFMSRLSPVFPFFLVNAAFAKTYISAITYSFVSQIGMLPGTAVFVNAGTQISKLDSLGGILSLNMIGAFALLGVFPLVSKKAVLWLKNRQLKKSFKKPKSYDYNLVVIGAGSGGLVSAYIAAAVKAKVALIEKHKMGGDCLNTGCVPSKAFIRSAKMLHYAKRASEWGFDSTKVEFDFANVMERVQNVIRKIEPHDSVKRYTELGVNVYEGEAKIIDPFRVEINGETLTTKNIVIATGARPLVPPIPGMDEVQPLTSDTLWNIRELPKRLVIVGGGPIGCELAQAFSRFGSKVTLLEGMNRLLLKEDLEVSDAVRTKFEAEGMTVLTGHMVEGFRSEGGTKVVTCNCQDEKINIECDEIIMALGRKANVTGFGLEELGVEIRKNGTIETDDFLRTNYPNIFAVGDVTGPYQFTHFAAHQAWYAAVNSLFSPFKKFKTDYRVIPRTTFTDPEVARVGINEQEAEELGLDFEVTRYGLDDLDRAIADGEDHGFVKVITPRGKDTILGAAIVGTHAGDILTEFVLAMKHGLGLNKILGTIHTYPTISEANKYLAGNWKKAHAPEGLLKWVQKFHTWRR